MNRAPSASHLDFEAFFNAAPNPYLVLTPDFTIAAANDPFLRATRSNRKDVVGRKLFEVFPENPEDTGATGARDLKASLQRVIQYRRPDALSVQKYDIPRPAPETGFEERYWSTLNSPVLDEYGAVTWIIHRVEDLTELVKQRQSTDVWDEATRDQLETIRQLREANETLARQIEDNKKLESRLARKAEELQAENAVRQETEKKLQSANLFREAVIEHIPGLLFVKDAKDHRFLLFNKSGLDLLGYRRDELIGKNDYDFFPKDQADHFVARDNSVLQSGVSEVTLEEPIATRQKGVRLLRTTKVPVLDEQGIPQYLLGFSDDITERKAIELQLRQAVKMEAVGQLTGGIAHDFNNLLGVIIGNLDLVLERPNLDEPIKDLAEGALEGALHGAEMVQRLLAFSGSQPLEPRVFDMNERLPQLLKLLERTLGEQIMVELSLAKDLWKAHADPAQFDETVLNLAINARDAMVQGGRLVISSANVIHGQDYASSNVDVTPGEYVMLSVEDTGAGIHPDVLERVFEPFFTTKDVEKGSGLGLSMVYGFVKQSSGHIKIESQPGKGTIVKLYLPRVDAQKASLQASDQRKARHAHGNETVLVVEDDEGMRQVGIRQMTELGYRTLEASSAKEALSLLDRNPNVDLLFTDVIMPGGMTGYELARAARKSYPKLKILLTSGYTAHGMATGFQEGESLELLAKPYRKSDLARKLRQVLSNG